LTAVAPAQQVERLHALQAAIAARDAPALYTFFTPDVVWFEADSSDGHVRAGRGRDDLVRTLLLPEPDGWVDGAVTVHGVLSNGVQAVAVVTWRGTLRETGRTVTGHATMIVRMETGGLIDHLWLIEELAPDGAPRAGRALAAEATGLPVDA